MKREKKRERERKKKSLTVKILKIHKGKKEKTARRFEIVYMRTFYSMT